MFPLRAFRWPLLTISLKSPVAFHLDVSSRFSLSLGSLKRSRRRSHAFARDGGRFATFASPGSPIPRFRAFAGSRRDKAELTRDRRDSRVHAGSAENIDTESLDISPASRCFVLRYVSPTEYETLFSRWLGKYLQKNTSIATRRLRTMFIGGKSRALDGSLIEQERRSETDSRDRIRKGRERESCEDESCTQIGGCSDCGLLFRRYQVPLRLD